MNTLFVESLKMAIDCQQTVINQAQAELDDEKTVSSPKIRELVAEQLEKQTQAMSLLKDYVKRNTKQ